MYHIIVNHLTYIYRVEWGYSERILRNRNLQLCNFLIFYSVFEKKALEQSTKCPVHIHLKIS